MQPRRPAAASGLQRQLLLYACGGGLGGCGSRHASTKACRKSRVPRRAPLRQGVVSDALSNQWERQQKAREEKLQSIKEQVEDGSLVIRKMTDEERKANPPKQP